MDQLAPSNVPTYESKAEGRSLWDRCADRGLPVVAVREGERGFVVRYDLQHLDSELSESALRKLRDQVRSLRSYSVGVDPLSETEHVGGETGHVAGELHAQTEDDARRLASHVSAFVFDDDSLV
ncbi:hypothetical protein [Halosimplex salinum]|uniref:hypothetical protein n=1 Tax=Halosimplex salinum TaxID=1710538 RepID=UPI000F4A10B3|nr:hypothetical protein [Halosimplex salinum]